MEDRSIVSFVGFHEGGHCGYCKGDEPLKASAGIWAFEMDVTHYNAILDRGMRRSGKYVYKPIIEKTCCPQYTIRLDVHKFRLSRSQKKVLRQMNEFLMNNTKPKMVVDEIAERSGRASGSKKLEESSMKKDKTEAIDGKLKIAGGGTEEVSRDDAESATPEKKHRGQKKKALRRERAFERMRRKGVDIEEVNRRRAEQEAARRRTVESFVSAYDPNIAAHKLEIKLVPLGSKTFKRTEDESYLLYKKYQETIHKDENCSTEGFKNFLCSTPLVYNEASPLYGTHHQQYRIDGKLVAVGVIDILPRCLSSKYFFYDPDYKFLSMGTYAALREIAYTKELSRTLPDLRYYYMGYYIESCPKMRYKARFRPSDLLCNTSFTWVPFEECQDALRKSDRVLAFAKNASAPPPVPVGSVLCLYKRMVMRYSELLKCPGFTETEDYMDDYARLLGSVATEMLLYRT